MLRRGYKAASMNRRLGSSNFQFGTAGFLQGRIQGDIYV